LGGKHLKKRGLVSLLIVSFIAIAAVIGVVFAFRNSGRQTDVYGSVTVSVDKDDIKLEIELEKDTTADNKFRIVETELSSAEFTITVDGLPSAADRSVEWNKSSVSGGIVSIERVGDLAEAGRTGINKFRVTGKNGGAPVTIVFNTVNGQTIPVTVTVSLIAKDMKLGDSAHFGVRQGAEAVDLSSSDILSKYVFYAHPEDTGRVYTPNKFPVEYRLKQDYAGVTLENGLLSVTDEATCVDQYIYLQVKLPAMDDWLDVPFYVFPAAETVNVSSTAYRSVTTADNAVVWDLIDNRPAYRSADFVFSLDYAPSASSSYGFTVESADTKMVRVDYRDQFTRSLSTVQNLGETAVRITAYPIVIDANGSQIAYSDESDANVQVLQTIYLRVRNDFFLAGEGDETYSLASDKESVDAFFYEGNVGNYYDTFTLNTNSTKTVNMDGDIEFELLVEDTNGKYTGTYRWDGTDNGLGFGLYDILQIGYWSSNTNDWVMLSGESNNYYTNYLNTFSIAFARTVNATSFLNNDNITLTLRAKSVNEVAIGGYATCDIKLDSTYAIDKFQVDNLTEFDDGVEGVALVYDSVSQSFSSAYVDVYGMVAYGDEYDYSELWNTAKVTDNGSTLPFVITCDREVSFEVNGVDDYYHMRYTFTADDIDAIEYYKDYLMTIKYTNGKTYTFTIRLYPTVQALNMSVMSNSKGKIYQTFYNDYDSESYNYVRTVYVRKGYDYQFAIDTPGVSVGAYAMFDEIRDANGNSLAVDTRNFDARELSEGIYTCTVTLHAYSEEVYQEHLRTITVYVIVVDPVGNVALPVADVCLDGIGDSTEIALNITNLDGLVITENQYLHIDIAQENENIIIEQGSAFNKFRITAKYVVDSPIEIGFKVYKNYAFDSFDLDGDGLYNEESYNLNYTAGSLVTANVTIAKEKMNSLTLSGNDLQTSEVIGNYLELISSGTVADTVLAVSSADDARNQDVGLTYVKWENGKFNLAPFVPTANDVNMSIGGIATACLNTTGSTTLTVTPVQNASSMAEYALVVYARDSLRYIETVDGDEYVLPDTYKIITIFVGSADDIAASISELSSGNVHDANSGVRNSLGSYNWVLKSTSSSQMAALFYTNSNNTYGSEITANVYYFDDLFTVLGWDALKTTGMTLRKYVRYTNEDASGNITYQYVNASGELVTDITAIGTFDPSTDETLGRRLAVNLNHKYSTSDLEDYYTHNNVTVYYEFTAGVYGIVTFYVVQAVDNFDVMISGNGSIGFVSRKNLSPDEYTSLYDTITLQRGSAFDFSSNLDATAGWKLNKTNFTGEGTESVSYSGGTYAFFPYINFDYRTTGGTSETYTFNLEALTSKIKVGVKGGANYLNIVQDSVSLDGMTTATYDLTLRIDQEIWQPSLLNYNFLYDGVYYTLFEDNSSVSYVNLEGGKAKLEFKLTCMNAANPTKVNSYYTYYMKIEVAVVIVTPDVDPFYDISGARLFVQENLEGSPLSRTKTALVDSSAFNLTKQGIYNVTMAHFADTNVSETNSSALTLTSGQTDSSIIYLDDDSAGGLLVIYPTPYYINVSNIALTMASDGYHTETVQIGTDLSGEPIYDTVTYSIGFTQMIYNEAEKYYQPYLNGSGVPQMVSSWSPAEGYKWTGRYYFQTNIISDSQVTYRLSDGTKFKIQISIQGESNAKAIVETMTLSAKYRDSFVITPDDDTEDYAVCTMTQTQYQAIGTTTTYDIALPTDCVPNYTDFTLNGTGSSTTTIQSTYANVTINTVTQTLSVYVKSDTKAIGQTIEIRIPYRRPGDYVNPYLSVVIVPVYFELADLEVIGHYESRLQLADGEKTQLQYRALFDYDTSSTASSSMSEKMKTFNNSLLTSSLVLCNYETANEITVEVPYTYVSGVPVLTKNGDCRYVHTFYYDIVASDATAKRTEYLAVGTASTYTFYNWNSSTASQLNWDGSVNASSLNDFWDVDITRRDYTTVMITVSLENNSSTVTDNAAYKKLIEAGKIVINVYSNSNRVTPLLELTIIPVYFTFDEFKLQNNPVNPVIALTTATTVTVEAGNINADTTDSDVVNAINTFNAELLNAQNNLVSDMTLSFSRIPNDDGVLNFNFDSSTRALTRADTGNPVNATSYLLVTAGVTYVNGIPTLNRSGNKMSTYIPVRTYGSDSDSSGLIDVDLDVAPNGRVRTLAQAIGTSVRYNIALPNTVYDSKLDKYEIRDDGNYVWTKDAGWNVVFNVKQSILTVTLNDSTDLFDKVLVVLAYNQEGELMYVLNIVPAYFTVEQVLLAEHIDENPVLIKNSDVANNSRWLQDLLLNYKSTHSSSTSLSSFDFETEMEKFLTSLNSSSLVSRIDDAGYITLIAGINYEGGIPTLVNQANSATIVQNIYRYELIDGIPENTKAQAIDKEVIYNVNHTFTSIKISTGVDAEGNDIWETFVASMGNNIWAVEAYTANPTCIKVILKNSDDLIGQYIRIGIFDSYQDANEPFRIINIIPVYFSVEDLAVAEQTPEDHNIILYYGEDPDSPDEVDFDAVYGDYSYAISSIPGKMQDFTAALQSADNASSIYRSYNTTAMSGDLHVTIYLNYESGSPVLVSSADANNKFVIRVDSDFWYGIYGRGASSELPSLPTGPRTRTEVQAVGTTASYTIDLSQTLSMDMDTLSYDDEKLAARGWKASFANNVFTLELLSDDIRSTLGTDKTTTAINSLLGEDAEDIEFNFYSGTYLVYVLTIQPVLFEVVGVETIHPEQPVSLIGLETTDVEYRAVAKYNANINYNGDNVVNWITRFNTVLNAAKYDLFEIEEVESDDQLYLKLDIALDYGVAGSAYRTEPKLLDVENNPLNVIESYVEYTRAAQSTSAEHYQAIGTTEYYYLGAGFKNATVNTVTINGVDSASVANYVTASLVSNFGGENTVALMVNLTADETLVDTLVTKEIVITINNEGSAFTLTVHPVWFVVEGFEVVGHPERHMWLIVSDTTEEKVGDLLFNVRARYAMDVADSVATKIQAQIDTFNSQLVDEEWSNYLETYTIGAQYLVVRAAVKYSDSGVAAVVNTSDAKPTDVVRDVFEYVRYSNTIATNGIAYPSIPRSRTVEVTVGYSATYTLDIPNLATISSDLIALYENNNSADADDDTKLTRYTTNDGSGDWQVEVLSGNRLRVSLKGTADAAADLITSELKVFIYYSRTHTVDAPDSYDVTNVAFILTIRPVLFKVTGFTLEDQVDDVIYVDNIDTFTNNISKIGAKTFVPVYQYNSALLDTEFATDNGNETLQTILDTFTSEFKRSSYVSKTRISDEQSGVYHFQVMTSVGYKAYQGLAYLTNEPLYRIEQSFKVVATGASTATMRTEYQALGTEKNYYIDDSVLNYNNGIALTTGMFTGSNYSVIWSGNTVEITSNDGDFTATWSSSDPNYVTVKLASTANVASTINLKISDSLTLQIKPVFFEILGFETVEHPERAVWVIDPYTVDDLQYRVITTDLSGVPSASLATVQEYIDTLNIRLNNGVAPKEITLEDNQYIVFDAAVNYNESGLPEFVDITADRRNVVESIINYRVYSATKIPNPEHPSVVGKTQSNQVIGKTKLYTLRNVKGQVFYQYLWVENGGSLVTSFDSSADGKTAVYEGLSILVDTARNTMQIQLAADSALLTRTICVYVPYIATVNGKEVWYSYCIEITPLLFELKGWTIAGAGDNSALITSATHDDYLFLPISSDKITMIKYVARINKCDDESLQTAIENAVKEIETAAARYMIITNSGSAVKLEGYYLTRYTDGKTDSPVGLATFVTYKNGVPELVESSNRLVSNQILISTGDDYDDWENNTVGKWELASGVNYAVQAIGTSANYLVEIYDAAKVFYDQIEAVDQNTGAAIEIAGERSNLISIDIEETDDDKLVNFTVNLAPVVALRDYVIEIQIPFADDVNATKPNYVYKYYITPAVFIVEGFYLADAENNSLALDNNDVLFDLCVNAYYADDVNVRNMANLLISSFETSLNNAIRNGTLEFSVINGSGGVNVSLLSYGNDSIVIHKLADLTALNYITSQIRVGYSAGAPKLGSVDPLTDAVIDFEIQVTTEKGSSNYFPGWDNITMGNGSQHMQAIGTSCDYPLAVNDMNVVFYYEYIEVFNAGFKRGENEYEFFDYQVDVTNRQNLTISVTLRASAKNLKDYIDIHIPYTDIVDGKIVWSYYSLQVKPVLFEVRGWKLKIGDEAYTSITLNDSAVELYFTPDVSSGPLNNNYYTTEELAYINSAIRRLEIEINTYDGKSSDGYPYLVINNTAQEGYQVNYTIFRDETSSISYLVRDIDDASTTVMQVSANVNYNNSDYGDELVDSAQVSASYSSTNYAQRVTSQISINTTDKTSSSSSSNNGSSTDDGSDTNSGNSGSGNSGSGSGSGNSGSGNSGSSDDNDGDDDDNSGSGNSHSGNTDDTNDGTNSNDDDDSSSTRPSVFIFQENASRLMNLSSDVDYIIMEDIYLSKIGELSDGRWKPVDFPTNTSLDGNNFRIFFDSAGFDLDDTPTNIGMFTSIPNTSVVKNLQIVFKRGTTSDTVTTLEIDLSEYGETEVSIGMIAGSNEGIITNCAVLSEWQFDYNNTTKLINPTTGTYFTSVLPFNKDGYLFDDNYFYKLGLDDDGNVAVVQVYNTLGFNVEKNPTTNQYDQVIYDAYRNVKDWISPDRSRVARYEDYSPIIWKEKVETTTGTKTYLESLSPAKLYVSGTNDALTVVLGGLVGSNGYMVTNSRVLIDVELYGPEVKTGAGAIDEVSVSASIVGGVVGLNTGMITSSFFRDASVINNSNANTIDGRVSLLGGFVGQNTGTIQQSYAMGASTNRSGNLNYISTAGAVKTIRNSLGGFVHLNSGTIKDCLVNMVIWKMGTEGAAGGFVYQNESTGVISNCVENNNITLQSSATLDFYAPFVYQNGTTALVVNTTNLSNLIYAGNAESISISDDWNGTLKRLSDNNTSTNKFSSVRNYEGFSIGSDDDDWEISSKNTIWVMTSVGPILREANEIAVSYRKYTWDSSPYLYNPGTAKNPYLVWSEDLFNEYIYSATAQATTADKDTTKTLTDIESSRQGNHIRLVDNITMTGIKDTYKIIYTGTFEGNGLSMTGISLDTVTNDLATMGLFGKTEFATIRNVNFEIAGINSTARYVGGIAGIAINTNFVDVSVTGSGVIKGANIVGGFVGLNVVYDSSVENYNLYSSVSVTANFHNQQTDVGADSFGSGIEYYRQTLYAKVEALNISYEQGYGTAGGVFGFITSNPNNYRVVDDNGNVTIVKREFNQTIIQRNAVGEVIAEAPADQTKSNNSEASWFLKDYSGNQINDDVTNGNGLYFTNTIILRNISGDIGAVSGNVAGGLIGIMDETIEMRRPSVTSLTSLTGKYYLGGLVGINLGKISGEEEGYNAMTLSSWTVLSSAGTSFVFRKNPSTETDSAQCYWGMTVGAVAGYNGGFKGNLNSGVIENINVSVNVLGTTNAKYMYIIGGVVGGNGDYGYIENSTNTNTALNATTNSTNKIQLTTAQALNVGYYFGRIIGHSDTAGSVYVSDGSTRMQSLRVNFPTTNGYITAANFATPGYTDASGATNAFGVENNTTLKIQTMTLDEYYAYLLAMVINQDLPTRVAMLEPWVRSLPTYTTSAIINGQTVSVEKYDEDAKQAMLDWIYENEVFETWDALHSALTGKVYSNYQSYLEYSAVSTQPYGNGDDGTESETEFENNLATYRNNRYKMAQTLFTYQYEVTGTGISGTQNANLTWKQYEDYLIFKANALAEVELDTNASDYNNFALIYGSNLAEMVYPTEEVVEYKGADTDAVMVNSNEIYRAMVSDAENYQQFTNTDPFQIYVNYVTLSNGETNAFQVGNTWKMSLAQYYYFMKNIYGQSYEYQPNESQNSITYSVPNHFTATKVNGIAAYYVMYVYTNEQLSSTSSMLTIPEFIDLMNREEEIVTENELAWVKTGHKDKGNNGTRISTIGAVELGWSSAADWNTTEQETVKADNGAITYGTDTEKQWLALPNYLAARNTLGLTITKYQQIIGMGGTLYELITNTTYTSAEANATDNYIFALQCEQYGWTDEQIEFIRNYYETTTEGTYDLQYALSATSYGDVLSYAKAGNGSIRVVSPTATQIVTNSGEWYTDTNGNTSHDVGEVSGVSFLIAETDNSTFTNGDGKEYQVYMYKGASRKIDLQQNGVLGAALYLDVDGNKLFGTSTWNGGVRESYGAGKDILIIYELQEPALSLYTPNASDSGYLNYPDFYTVSQDENGKDVTTYYRIARKILENSEVTTTDSAIDDATNNRSDYLEEALWWRAQEFTAAQFDQIKYHVMTQSITTGYVSADNQYTTRALGYTLADDWYASSGAQTSGFKSEQDDEAFTQAEYLEIVMGAHYTKKDGSYVWYSTYADYKLFVKVYNASVDGTTSIAPADIENSLVEGSGSRANYQYPFIYTIKEIAGIKTGTDTSYDFLVAIAPESELADAIEFASTRAAFMTLFRAGSTTAEYITWAQSTGDDGFAYTIIIDNKDTTRVFRLNHYIYYVQEDLDNKLKETGDKFNATDFRWVLNQDVRINIFYDTVTQESRTTDLVTYRMDWYNNGDPFMTFRDYYEWINIYAYSDAYKTARGEIEQTNVDVDTGETSTETLRSTDGWLTIEAFAVWKRMEKYENNVEYLAKISGTTTESPITAPILKRQISTTVFPKIQSSGEKPLNEYGSATTSDNYVLPQAWADASNPNAYINYYGWASNRDLSDGIYSDTYKAVPMDADHQRFVIDRYEYNERYNIRNVNRILYKTDEHTVNNSLADDLINDAKNSKTCDDECGGKVNGQLNYLTCNDPTHAAYQYHKWVVRYGVTSNNNITSLRLDEVKMDTSLFSGKPATDQYVQLYVPYEYFEQACKMIKSVYSESNGYAGYFNYMKYWAKNGNYNWICNQSEYAGSTSGMVIVKNTYTVTNFWNNYDGTKSPVDNGTTNVDGKSGTKAFGWKQA